jgi:hypothetical protein
MKEGDRRRATFADRYPNVDRWARGYGWIELGEDLLRLAWVGHAGEPDRRIRSLPLR